jgi:membrane-anchored glycerophosphoryl diester phosphodiesterase (GDPDase)
MLLMLGRFVYSKVKSGLVQKLALAVVLIWAALVTMTSNRLIIRACALRSVSKSFVLRAFAQEEGSQ